MIWLEKNPDFFALYYIMDVKHRWTMVTLNTMNCSEVKTLFHYVFNLYISKMGSSQSLLWYVLKLHKTVNKLEQFWYVSGV